MSDLRHCKAVDPVRHTFDINSILMQIWSLALFFKGGFNISYYPPFAASITADLHVKMGGHRLHRMRHLQLGHSEHNHGWSIHVYFPGIICTHRTKNTLHLTNYQQKMWVDEVLLPSLQKSCPEDVVHHHPQSFQKAQLKMWVRRDRCRRNEAARSLNMHHIIPGEHLPSFWRGSRPTPTGTTSSAISSSSFTPRTSSWTPRRGMFRVCRTKFLDYMDAHFNLAQMTPTDAWVDIAFEDTSAKPVGADNLCVTFPRWDYQ